MSAAGPTVAPVRCSPLDAWYRASGEGMVERDGMPQPQRLKPGVAVGPAVSLTDLSWRRRFGVKGPGAPAWLEQLGFTVPAPPNSWACEGGALVGRLATSEFLVEALTPGSAAVAAAARQLTGDERPASVYPVARQDLVLRLHGPALNALLRQICSVDFATLLGAAYRTAGPLVLTSMIGVGAVVAPEPGPEPNALTVWVDPSFAYYFWTTLVDVAADLGGGVHLDPTTGA